uniref:Uncharacterized protein n=1 Tax=Glossina pallidipes TaxID=7398 RepID=A0A1B0A1M5_GLOPL
MNDVFVADNRPSDWAQYHRMLYHPMMNQLPSYHHWLNRFVNPNFDRQINHESVYSAPSTKHNKLSMCFRKE